MLKLKEIKECRVCRGSALVDVLDLGMQPWGNDFRNEPYTAQQYPLQAVFCKECSTFQIKHNVPKEIMYADHTYLSGANKSMEKHFLSISKKASTIHNPGASFVVDIGSNDGTLLSTYKKLGLNVLGVEPCEKISKKAIDTGIPTIIDFFNEKIAIDIINNYGKADIISAANVFYHVEELHDIADGIKKLLADDGVFIVQGTYLPNLIQNNEFDIIYHEHLLYYRVENLNHLLRMHGLEIFDIEFADVHGGSFVSYISHVNSREIMPSVKKSIQIEREKNFHKIDPYIKFAKRVKDLKSSIKDLLIKLKSEGYTIYAYGAPVKGTVMLNYCDINSSIIDYAAEVNNEKIGKYIPGADIPVKDEASLEEPDFYFLLSWNFLDQFKESDMFKSGKRKFILPIPEPRIISK